MSCFNWSFVVVYFLCFEILKAVHGVLRQRKVVFKYRLCSFARIINRLKRHLETSASNELSQMFMTISSG